MNTPTRLLFVSLFASLMGCGAPMPASDSGVSDAAPSPAASCTGISGSYTITGTRSSGSCPGNAGDDLTVDIVADPSSTDGYALAFTSNAATSYNCLGRLVGCQLMTTCNAVLNGDVATLDATWNFTNAGFSGTHAYRATLADSTMCTASFAVTAARR